MIGWSIEVALKSGCFDKVVVSTDDAKIAEVARNFGAEVPFIRPADLSDDHATTVPVIAHATAWYQAQGHTPTDVCCLYATAPFVQVDDLQKGFAQLQSSGAQYVFSATDFGFPIQRAMYLSDTGRVAMLHPEHANTRSQDLQETYHDAGQFYWGRAQAWLDQLPLMGGDAEIIYLPSYRVQDIDTEADWRRAELLFQALKST
jgi:N-acylneuraminate cytidylyltransferase